MGTEPLCVSPQIRSHPGPHACFALEMTRSLLTVFKRKAETASSPGTSSRATCLNVRKGEHFLVRNIQSLPGAGVLFSVQEVFRESAPTPLCHSWECVWQSWGGGLRRSRLMPECQVLALGVVAGYF